MNVCSYCRKPVPEGTRQCPHCFENLVAPGAARRPVRPTVLDVPIPQSPGMGGGSPKSVLGDMMARSEPPMGAMIPPMAGVARTILEPPTRVATMLESATSETPAAPSASPFRPFLRPPQAKLCVVDDGCQGGEWIRIRGSSAIIGRVDADVVIPHDNGVSAQHAEIVREAVDGQFRWFIRDLNSTNGTFVKIKKTKLQPTQEILIGARRYYVRSAQQAAAMIAQAGESEPSEQPKMTRAWKLGGEALAGQACLVELTPTGDGRSYGLIEGENWIGNDAQQVSVVIWKDPMCSARHAKLFKDAAGYWHIEDAGSDNGVWLRVKEREIVGQGQFQLGEQRFKLRIL